mgnify:FL=1
MREARLKAVPLLLYAAFPPLTLRDAQRSRFIRWGSCLSLAK